jgi:hypothetical protein
MTNLLSGLEAQHRELRQIVAFINEELQLLNVILEEQKNGRLYLAIDVLSSDYRFIGQVQLFHGHQLDPFLTVLETYCIGNIKDLAARRLQAEKELAEVEGQILQQWRSECVSGLCPAVLL